MTELYLDKVINAFLGIRKNLINIWVCLLFTSTLSAQDDNVLTFANFFEIVKLNHPVAKQADLGLLKGDASLLGARGNFDPQIAADLNQKYFKQEKYYGLLNGVLKIPTWYGLTLENGYEQNVGTRLDPENSTPENGLWFVGVSLSLGQGLAIDQRRAVLRQAKLFEQQTAADRMVILNDLIFQASLAYYEWQLMNERMGIFQAAAQLARERLSAIRGSIIGGDRPAIDSIEANIQWQSREQLLQQASIDLQNARSALSLYLWNDQRIPLEIYEGAKPETLRTKELRFISESMIEAHLRRHPKLISNQLKIASLDIDQRWSREQLKPVIDLKYRPITEAINNNPLAALNTEDYLWGLSVKSSLFLRKERSKLRLAQIKVEEAELANTQDQQSIRIKSKIALDSWRGFATQIEQLDGIVEQYQQLLVGERTLFQLGESSLFLLNARETSLINSQLKRLEVLMKRQVAEIKLYYETGMLGDIL